MVVLEGSTESMVTTEVHVGAATATGRVGADNRVLTTTLWTDKAGGCGEAVVQSTGDSRVFGAAGTS